MYLEHFGFREKPFNVTPDPRFFYSNPVYQETYAGLLYGIRERKGFVSLIGEVGTGKTTLLRKLMSELREPVHFVYVCYTTLTFEELLSFICADLGLVLTEKSHLQRIQALNDFLLEVSKQGGTGVLLVDEAQNLGDDVLENLRLLSNLETASEKLLQIVLVGQPELERKLAQPKLRQLKQRIAIQGRLGRLKEREVGPFIASRLMAVGYEGEELFAPEAVQRIATYSKGTPRLINVICDNALLVAYSLNQQSVRAEVIEEVARDLQLKPEARSVRVSGPSAEVGFREDEESDVVDEASGARIPTRVAATGTEILPLPREPFPGGGLLGRRLPRVLGGAVLALALLGGAGAAIFPGQLTHRLSDLTTRIGEWFGATSQPVVGQGEERGVKPFSPTASVPTEEEIPRASEEKLQAALPPLAQTESKEKPTPTPRVRQTSEPPQQQAPLTPTAAASAWKEHPVLIESRMTVFDLVLKTYGGYNILAVDLIRENNPHLKNLEKIMIGEKIWLPPLTQETLVREQPKGGYHLIVGSFRTQREAERFAQKVRSQGYEVTITPRKIIDNFVVQRVEIRDLKSLDEVQNAWELVNTHNVFSVKPAAPTTGLAALRQPSEQQ
jgi:type II secretory pathway predicted ATPase ExeA